MCRATAVPLPDKRVSHSLYVHRTAQRQYTLLFLCYGGFLCNSDAYHQFQFGAFLMAKSYFALKGRLYALFTF